MEKDNRDLATLITEIERRIAAEDAAPAPALLPMAAAMQPQAAAVH